MRTLKFKKIDAFTKGISSGNPAGYVFLNDDEFLTVVQDICNNYVKYGTLSEKQEALVSRVYFIHCT